MADNWWDNGGGFSLGGGDSGNWWDSGQSFDIPVFDTPSYDFGGFNSNLDTGFLNQQPNFNFANQPMGAGIQPGMGGGTGGYGSPSWSQVMSNPQTILGLGGGIAGLIGAITGGGVQQQRSQKLSTPQKAQYEGAQKAAGGINQFAKGNTPLQQQQMQLLQAIAGGQGLAQPYAQAVEQAFEPQMGSLYEQATAAGRKRGFHDAPATSPAGGAVLGPGLSNLQGQIAQAKLAMMMGLPGLYQQPINQQSQAAQAFAGQQGSLFGAYPGTQTWSQPLGPTIGQSIGQSMIGLGQGLGQQQMQNQQNQFYQQLLQRNQTPYQFGGYSGQ